MNDHVRRLKNGVARRRKDGKKKKKTYARVSKGEGEGEGNNEGKGKGKGRTVNNERDSRSLSLALPLPSSPFPFPLVSTYSMLGCNLVHAARAVNLECVQHVIPYHCVSDYVYADVSISSNIDYYYNRVRMF